MIRALEALLASGFSHASALRASAAVLLLVLGLRVEASAVPRTFRNGPVPAGSYVTVIPRAQREVTVSWTVRAMRAGTRVVLLGGPSVGRGEVLAERTTLGPGLNDFEFVDRSEREDQRTYWLVVVDDHGRESVLGARVCASHGLNGGSAPTGSRSVDPVLSAWAGSGQSLDRQALAETRIVVGDLLLEAPPAPPPEGFGAS